MNVLSKLFEFLKLIKYVIVPKFITAACVNMAELINEFQHVAHDIARQNTGMWFIHAGILSGGFKFAKLQALVFS